MASEMHLYSGMSQPMYDTLDDEMTLSDLIACLGAVDAKATLSPGLGKAHSWRGRYEELAFEAVESCTVGEARELAMAAMDTSLHGYKGGKFEMGPETLCHLVHGEGGSAGPFPLNEFGDSYITLARFMGLLIP